MLLYYKTIRQKKRYKKSENFINEKNVKISKPAHAFKGFASSDNVEILNSFSPELQLKDTASAIKSTLIIFQSHNQLQDALDVDLETQTHVHTCVSTYNKVMISCRTH